jgi:hypothetical protein
MAEKTKEMSIKIINADVWASTWITNYFYRNLDNEILERVELKNLAKSKDSIEFEIILAFLMAKAMEMKIDKRIYDYLKKWLNKRKQTTLEIYINNERLKADEQ